MADFEADKTSGTGPALVMVHPLKVNDTEADKRRLRNIRHDNNIEQIRKNGFMGY